MAAEGCSLESPVVAFLADLGFQCYAEAFRCNGFDTMVSVMSMERDHMRDLGMLPGHVLKLEAALAPHRAHRAAQVLAAAAAGGATPAQAQAITSGIAPAALAPPPSALAVPSASRWDRKANGVVELIPSRQTTPSSGEEDNDSERAPDAEAPPKPGLAVMDGTAGMQLSGPTMPVLGLRHLASGPVTRYIAVHSPSPGSYSVAQSPFSTQSGSTWMAAKAQTMTGTMRGDAALSAWLRQNDFYNVNTERRKIGGRVTFPLHQAVEECNAMMVELLLRAGANPQRADSNARTPLQLAERRNKKGSHDQVIKTLNMVRQTGMATPVSGISTISTVPSVVPSGLGHRSDGGKAAEDDTASEESEGGS